MVKVLKPETIVNYSQTPDDIFDEYRQEGIEIVEIISHLKGNNFFAINDTFLHSFDVAPTNSRGFFGRGEVKR